MEVGDHRVGDGELVGDEDELVRPAVKLLEVPVRTDGRLDGAHDGGADGADAMVGVDGRIDGVDRLATDDHLLGVDLVFGEILDVDFAIDAQPRVDGEVDEAAVLDLESAHQLAAEVESGSGGYDGALLGGVDGLVALLVFLLGLAVHVFRNRRLAQFIELLLEGIVVAFAEEAQRTSARGGVVDHLGHEVLHVLILAEIELVADADLTRRVDQHVPQAQALVQLAQQEDLDPCAGLLLVAIEAGGEDARVVHHKHVASAEVFD